MYSGIVEEIGTVKHCNPTDLVIEANQVLDDLAIKDSIAVDGVCLTVTELGDSWFRVDVMPETLRCTDLGSLQLEAKVNLERSLAANGRIGGHMVQGHVEACIPVLSIQEDGIGLSVEFALPVHLRPYIVSKGFVALNGISLTVVEVKDDRFSIALIPYTREHTNLGQLQVGTKLNLETDILGRYIAQHLRTIQEQT
ncbi:MAG TPA: riboflavin synthase [Ktedonobacteraceae bacterium]|jgi:riboflavin synthase